MSYKYLFVIIFFSAILFSQEKNNSHPKIAIVLSGGGARGIAQLGALKILEQKHIPIDLIVGNSMGSVIGGLYASGYSLAEIETIALHTDWEKLLSISGETERTSLFVGQKEEEEQGFLLLRMDGFSPVLPISVSSGQRLTNFLNMLCIQSLYYPQRNFDELKIPFRSVCTDLVSGKRIVMAGGSLMEAMRASISVPLMFSPLRKDSMLLLDGGLVSNIPVDVAKSFHYDVIVAINSTSYLRRQQQIKLPWESADQIMNIMMVKENNEQLSQADVVISPNIGEHLSSDFSNLRMLISEGEKAANEQLPLLLEKISSFRKEVSETNTDSVSTNQFPLLKQVQLENSSSNNISQEMFNDFFGKQLSNDTVQQIREKILASYRSNGLSIADIDSVSISSDGELSLQLNEGRIDSIKIDGNIHTADYVILRELPFDIGDVFTIEEEKNAVQNILSTGLFEQIYIDVEKHEKKNIVVIHLIEKSSEILRAGFRIDNERNFQILVEAHQENFLNAGQDFGIGYSGGFRNRTIRLRYNVNRLFNTYFNGDIKSYYKFHDVFLYRKNPSTLNELDRISIGEYRETKYGGSFSFGSQVARFGNVNGEVRIENHETKDNSSMPIFSGERFTLASLKGSLLIDSEDEFVFPTSGVRFSLSYELGTKSIGSERSYTKIFAMHQSYWSPFRDHTFRPRITFGFADATLPLSEQFSLGGQESFYGKREDDARGRQLFLVNMEYRYKLPFKILFDTYIKMRYDLGMISKEVRAIAMRNFQHGVGIELAFDTPIGSASVAVGKPFVFEKLVTETKFKFGPTLAYFSVGQKF